MNVNISTSKPCEPAIEVALTLSVNEAFALVALLAQTSRNQDEETARESMTIPEHRRAAVVHVVHATGYKLFDMLDDVLEPFRKEYT